MLFQRLNQFTEEVKRQGTTTGDASCYRGRRARGCLIWPFVFTAAYSSERKKGKGWINSFHHPPDVLPQVDPIQTHVHACYYFKMYIRKCGVYHSSLGLRIVDSLHDDACIMLEDAFSCIQTASNDAERSVKRNKIVCWCSANQNNHTGLSVRRQVWGVRWTLLSLHELISRSLWHRYLPLIIQRN